MTIKAGTQTIPETAVIAAAQGIYKRHGGINWDSETESIHGLFMRDAKEALEAAAPFIISQATDLISDLTDPDECSFDHHGGCQAHGYLSLQPGETCPQHDAKEWAKTFGGGA